MFTLDLCAEVCEDHRLGNMSTEWKYVNKGDSNTILSSIYLKTRFLKLELYYIHVYIELVLSPTLPISNEL